MTRPRFSEDTNASFAGEVERNVRRSAMSALRPNIGHLIGLVAILKPATGLGSS